MRRAWLCTLLVSAGTAAGSGPASAAVLGFDDLPNGTVTGAYAGFVWSHSWKVLDDASYRGTYRNTYGSPSGPGAREKGPRPACLE
jgi:hypothetical protein